MPKNSRSVAIAFLLLAAGPSSAQPVLLVSNAGGTNVIQFSPGNPATTYASGFNTPTGMAVDAAKTLYVSDAARGTVYKVSTAGAVTPFASVPNAIGLAFDSAANLYVASGQGNSIDKVTPGGSVSTFATGFNGPFGMAFDTNGNLYVANNFGNSVSKVTSGGSVTTFASGFSGPTGLAFDASGNLFVANALSNLINKVSPSGAVSPFANVSQAGASGPQGLTFGGDGNLYVACNDPGGSGEVDRVTPAGSVTSVLTGGLSSPSFIIPSPIPEPSAAVLVGFVAAAAVARCLRRGRRPIGDNG